MMLTIFLHLVVVVLIQSLARSINPPPLPHTGVQLYGGYNNITYPNNSIIPASHFHRDDRNKDGLNDALWCQSAKNEPNIGVWYYPNGTQVSTVDNASPLHSVHMSGQIGLYRDYGINKLEGIYKCVIPDELNVNQTLMIALYTMYTYEVNSGPKINKTTFKSLPSTKDDSAFLISFIVTDGTATYINCTLNDTLIYPNITQTILSYQLPTKILVDLLFQSRDEGWYNCSVSNTRVEDKYYNNISQAYPAHNNIYVKVAEKPVNVTAKWVFSSDVLVTWSPPVNNNPLVDGYEVFYAVNDCNCKTVSVGVTNYTKLIITGLCSSQNYSFFVMSYSNEEHTLPSEWSDITTLIADNKITLSSFNEIMMSSTSTSSIDINDFTTPNGVTSSSVKEIMMLSTLISSSIDINDFTTLNAVNEVTLLSVNELMMSSTSSVDINDAPTSNTLTLLSVNELMMSISSIDINDAPISNTVNEVILSSVNKLMMSSILTSSIDNNIVTTSNTVNEVSSLSVNEIKLLSTMTSLNGMNRATLSSINEVTIIVKPMPTYPSNDNICKENSPLLSSWLIIVVVFLFFTNIITVIVLIINCFWWIRRKYEKFDIMKARREYTGHYLSSRNGIIVESELNDGNPCLRDNGNEEDDTPYSSHIYAVVDNKKDNNESPIYSTATTEGIK